MSNKTLTEPKFANGGFIADANGNEMLVFNTTANAVNYLDLTNGATGNAIVFAAKGDDTDISLKITPKGTGTLDVISTTAIQVPVGTTQHKDLVQLLVKFVIIQLQVLLKVILVVHGVVLEELLILHMIVILLLLLER